jgi:dienelactone hydrolase
VTVAAGACALALVTTTCRSTDPPLQRVTGRATTTTELPATVPPPSTVVTSSTSRPVATRPFRLASSTLPLVDASRPAVANGHAVSSSRPLTTLVWRPVAGGRWPLIVFAHGFRVGPTPYEHLCQAWASAGYVVAAPEFPLTDADVAGPNLDENDIANQPADVRFVIASLLATSSPVRAAIDPTRVAVAGHSDGAVTALALADDQRLDLRAVVVLSGGTIGRPVTRNAPILVAHGDQDTTDPPDQGQAVYDQASRPKFLLHLLGAGHLPPFAGGTRWQPVVDRVTVEFLDRYVSGSAPAGDALLHDGQRGLATLDASA